MDVSVEKQFKERKSRNVLYSGLFLFSILLISFFGYLNSVKAATSPNIITYQGKLLNGGMAVTTTQAISYVLYDDPTAGNALYSAAGTTSSPSTVSTTVTDGFFTIDLGDTGTNPIDPQIFKNNSAVYLKVTIGGEVLSPRKRITASPFAINSKYLDGVGASSTPQSSTYIPVSDASGNFNFNNVTSTGLTATSASFVNASSTGSFWSNLLTAATGWFTNLFWTDATSTGHTSLNTLTTTGNTNLATTTISSSTIGYLNVTNNEVVGGTLSVIGNSYFGNIASGTWQGTVISNAYGGIGQDSSGWTGFIKTTDGVWSTTTLASTDLTDYASLLSASASNVFTGQNTFSATSTFAAATFNGYVGIGTTSPQAKLHVYSGNFLVDSPFSPTLIGSTSSISTLDNGMDDQKIKISGKYAYVAGNGTFMVYDVSTKNSPILVGSVTSSVLNTSYSLKIFGKYAYVMGETSYPNFYLVVIDISNPALPTLVSSLNDANFGFSLEISGKYAYVGDLSNGLSVVDISNPSSLVVVSHITSTQSKLSNPRHMTVSGRYLYVGNYDVGDPKFTIVDIIDPTNPVVLGYVAVGNAPVTSNIYISGKFAYYLHGGDGTTLAITDISNPSNPVLVSDLSDGMNFNRTRNIFVSGKYAYIIGGQGFSYGFMTVVDISNPQNPVIKNLSTSPFSSSGVLVSIDVVGKYAYVIRNDYSSGQSLVVVDLNGAEISSADIGNIATDKLTVWENIDVGNNLNIRNGLNVGVGGLLSNGATTISVSTAVSTSTLFSVGTSTLKFLSVNGNGYIGIGTSTPSEKLHVFNGTLLVDNPTPTLLGSYNTTGTVFAVDVSGKYAYVADDISGLEIFEISNPTNPTLVGYYDTTGAAWDVKISGKYAYVADGGGGLLVFDVSEPGRPLLVGSYDTPGSATNVYLSGKYAYVSDVTSLIILDVSNPSNISLASRLTTVTPIKTYVSGEFAYIAKTSSGGLSIVNISNPYSPVFVTSTYFASNSSDVYVSGRYAYLANYDNDNVVVYDISVPAYPVQISTISLVGSKGVYVSGEYLYVNSPSSFNVFDLSNNNALVGSYSSLTDATSLKIVGKYAYISDGIGGLKILDIKGAEISSANIGNIATNDLTIWENTNVGNDLYVHNGLSVGAGGLLSNGALAVNVSSTISSNTIFSVGTNTTSSIMAVNADGTVTLKNLTVSGNSYFNTIASGTWNGTAISNTYGGTGQNSSGWTGFVKTIAGVWSTSSISINDITGTSTLAILSNDQTFTGANTFSGTSTFNNLLVNEGRVGNPVLKGSLANGGSALLNGSASVYVYGNYAYVASEVSNALEIVDISNPSNPVHKGSLSNGTGGAALLLPRSIYVSGNYAYIVGGSDALEIVDISNPAAPVHKGKILNAAGGAVLTTTNNGGNSIYVSGNYAYIASYGSNALEIVDISNPAAPVHKGKISSDTYLNKPKSVYVSGHYAYVGIKWGNSSGDYPALGIFDISNPSSPVYVGNFSLGAASGKLPESVYVSGKYAYIAFSVTGIADSNAGLKIVDISDPFNPVVKGTITNSLPAKLDYPSSVFVSGNYAYVYAARSAALEIVDITSSTNPIHKGVYTGSGSVNADYASAVFVSGNYAYAVSNATSKLEIIDVSGSSISNSEIGTAKINNLSVLNVADFNGGMNIRGGLNIGTDGLLSSGPIGVNVSTTISTSSLFSVYNATTSSLFSIMGDGKIGIGTSTPSAKLHLYDGTLLVDNPRSPTLLGSVTSSSLQGIYANYVSGNYAYTAASTGSLSVIDITNKNSPTIVGSYVSSTVIGVSLSIAGNGNYIYLGNSTNDSVVIFDVSNPSNPVKVGSVTDATRLDNPANLSVVGKYVYASCYTGGGVTVVDVANPASPSILGQVTSTDKLNHPKGIYVAGNYAYVADSTNGSYGTFTVLDISLPRTPSIIGFVSSTVINTATQVYISGRYAYLTGNGGNVLSIIDISNPASPSIVGGIADNSYGTAKGLMVAGKYAYVGTYSYMLVVDVSSPTAPVLVGRYSNTSITDGAQAYSFVGKYAYVSGNTNNYFAIMDLQGANISSADIGNISTNKLTVWENSDFGNNLYVRNAINVGVGGITSNGPISVMVSSTSGDLLSIGTSTNSNVFKISSNGNIQINTSTFGGTSYKMLIDAGDVNNGAIGVNGFIKATSYIAGTTTLDLAETYPINMLCVANGTCPTDGDVVCADPTVIAGVKKCVAGDAEHMVGIISTNPGFLLGGADLFNSGQNAGVVKVALAGRVPVKVSTINGNIVSGDKLTLSDIDGAAAKAVGEVPIVGIAMENYSGAGEGSIIAFVNLGWQNQLYKALTVDTNSSTLTVGSDLTPYNLALSGEFTMFNNVLNRLVFNATAVFETKTNDSHAFVFNALNFNTSSDKYLLSLRSNGDPRFSVMANGDIRASGDLYAASAIFGTSTNPGDLAERVDIASDDVVEPGDVLVVDLNNPDTYRRSSGQNEQAVAGVVSTNPTIVVGNGKTEYTSVMAMVGRVPLKVSDENGVISRGDLLVTASSTGYAMKYDAKKDDGEKMIGVVGVALDPFTGGKGKIMALVRTGWVNSRYQSISSIKDNIEQLATAQGIVFGVTSTVNLNIENTNGQLTYSGGNLNLQGNMLLNVASISGKNNRWSIDESGHFITKINTSQGEKEMYAIQSPTSEFVFSSSSQLIAGEAIVSFNQTMQDIIDSAQPLKINITLTSGEAKGIYVSEKNIQGFTVKELDSGKSGATFDWMVVAKRKEEITNLNVIENLPNNLVVSSTENNVQTSTSPITSSGTPDVVTQSPASAPAPTPAPILSAPAVVPAPVSDPVIVSSPAPVTAPTVTVGPVLAPATTQTVVAPTATEPAPTPAASPTPTAQ